MEDHVSRQELVALAYYRALSRFQAAFDEHRASGQQVEEYTETDS